MSLAAEIKRRDKSILILDVERLPGRFAGDFWDMNSYKNRRIHADDVVEWPRIICVAAKWLGDRRPMFQAVWNDGEDPIRWAWELYGRADIVVGHNLARADTPWLQAEWIQRGWPDPTPWKTVDTLKVARQRLGFESNTLDAICQRLGIAGKNTRYNVQMARDAVDGVKGAQRTMASYNKNDVNITEKVYRALRGRIQSHPPIWSTSGHLCCNQCGSMNLKQAGTYNAVSLSYDQWQCEDCGGWMRGEFQKRISSLRGVK